MNRIVVLCDCTSSSANQHRGGTCSFVDAVSAAAALPVGEQGSLT
jgi:hypothetical protein